MLPEPDAGALIAQTDLLLDSHLRVTGRPLLADAPADPRARAEALFRAPFVVVSHGIEADPVFNYGNASALARFEMTWAEFVALPSRFSAEPVNRDERARLLAAVTAKGYIDDYAGVRIAKSGPRFRIRRATVWNLIDAAGVFRGQAATFAEVTSCE